MLHLALAWAWPILVRVVLAYSMALHALNNLIGFFNDYHAIIDSGGSHETSDIISSDSGSCSLPYYWSACLCF